MTDVTEFNLRQRDPQLEKKSTVTGIRDRSEVEQMIQRYLELAASALNERDQDRDKEISA
jgi:hypothetical protein